MDEQTQKVVLAHVQYCAMHFLAYRGSLEKLLELIAYSIGAAAPDPAAISNFLRREETQKILELEWETALWRSSDYNKSWRLISLAFQTDVEVCKRRLAKRPPSSDCCAFCWQGEKGFTTQLIPEKDIYGNPTCVYLHRQCARPWDAMRRIVARSE